MFTCFMRFVENSQYFPQWLYCYSNQCPVVISDKWANNNSTMWFEISRCVLWKLTLIIIKNIKRIVINKILITIILIIFAIEMIERSFISNCTCKAIHKIYSTHVFNIALRVHADDILKAFKWSMNKISFINFQTKLTILF